MPAALPRATLAEKIAVLDYLHGPPRRSQLDTIAHFKHKFALSQATLSSWTQQELKLREQFNSNPNLRGFRRKPVLKHPELMQRVENHIKQLANNGNGSTQITDNLIRSTFYTFAQEMDIDKTSCVITPAMIKSLKRRTLPKHAGSSSDIVTIPSPSLDFNFDEIFNNPTVGFNTRLIHPDDTFSQFLQTPVPSLLQEPAPFQPEPAPTPTPTLLPDTNTLPYFPTTYDNPLNNTPFYTRQRTQNSTFNTSIGSKQSNPNSEKIERILETITNGHVTLYNSGTSAIMGVLSFLNPKHVYIDDMGYKGTHQVIKLLNKLTNVEKHPLSDLNVSNVIPLPNSVIIIESPMNPLGFVHDISRYSKFTNLGNNCKLIVDSTLAPPPLQFPFKHGADYVVYSAVKYLAGVSDLSAGFVVSKDKISKNTLHNERSALGTSIANFDSFLLLRSLRTYKMRILTQCQNTEKIISYLIKSTLTLNTRKNYNKIISKIYHSSLQDNKEIVMSQLNGYYNPVFALELSNDKYPEILLEKFNFLSNNPNLEGGETLVELIHGNPNFNTESQSSPYKNIIRFSVGCEDYQDIIRDLDQALSSLL